MWLVTNISLISNPWASSSPIARRLDRSLSLPFFSSHFPSVISSTPNFDHRSRNGRDGHPHQTLEFGVRSQEEEELEKFDADVAELAVRIVRYRRTIPEQLKVAFAFLTSSESLYLSAPAEAGVASASRGLELSIPSLSSRNGEAATEKIELLKHKTLSNASAMGPLLNRMRDCISRIDTVNSSKDSIHPVFMA